MAELSDAASKRLTTERTTWLCTVRPDGSPHVTPVWFVYRDDTWWISTQEGNRKTRNLIAEPRVSLALPDGDAPLVAEGRAVVHRELHPEIVAAFAEKYDGWDLTEPGYGSGASVLVEVPVTRWLLAGEAH
ncbi:PPOX class probable F420-dependent enzyme [Actinoalloteichus hoggarensis]|uniref:Pyridoxamine 5'-phosphate oxidase n=1 Tax=Actinoalloteichus hoggarensis TaxID=1470176 RepID=A0A221W7A9_9PSEU|nr:pyridoxamine 5'-phosphate oxidase family protein [Actinoalloteichus hoggarensis]ASO21832.1 Pyridoxamine 5'-phosphate oxidase [Actinoalloteichus hoggarensis]MBB5922431.1 PPOX class probable F420-dependent enzyme [Actinoalloteichus hoggarensis]